MTTPKKRNTQDATLINVRASRAHWLRLRDRIARLEQRVRTLERARKAK